ncbi:unnamed protein product, partial [Vitis vinifera]|uniref:Uncharacterized protein n=1 Tax=Vitis vinifera TaxID=29760 RepID=D7T7P8_VITVI
MIFFFFFFFFYYSLSLVIHMASYK